MKLSRFSWVTLTIVLSVFLLSQFFFQYEKVSPILMIALKPVYEWRINLLKNRFISQEIVLGQLMPETFTCVNAECKNMPTYFYQAATEALGNSKCESNTIEFRSKIRSPKVQEDFDVRSSQNNVNLHVFSFLEESYLKLVLASKSARGIGRIYNVQNNCGGSGTIGIKFICSPADWTSVIFDRDCKVQMKSLSKLFNESQDRECIEDNDCELYSLTGCPCSSSSYSPFVRNKKYRASYSELISFFQSTLGNELICNADLQTCPKAACKSNICSILY